MPPSGSPDFVHLHLHTDYSLLDGACEIGELTAEAARRGMRAVAVTDHGNLFAAANFYHQATTHGVKPIIGCEVYVAPDNHKNRGAEAERSNHLVLLCENEEGYRNLIQLVSTGFLDGFYYKPRVDHELLAQHSKGLIALSACLRGEVADALLSEKYEQAKTNAYRLRDIFGKGNFFLEVQDQGMEIETRINRDLVSLSKETGIPLVATNDCHYLTRSDAHAQEVLMCIQTGKTMSDAQRMKFATDQFYFKTAEEMAQVFRELPDAVSRTVAIADRCNLKIQRVGNPFPEFKVPEGHTTDSYFERVVREGFASRVPLLERLAKENLLRHPLQQYEQRLSDEIEMIKKMRFAGYFLIVWDFIRYARAQEVPVGPGRGSAAGSLVSYALRITDVDPLQYDLLFERFLNPERVSMPDIDIDFCMRRRGEVIEYVRRTYGEKSVAQIITFGTMAAKAVLKDAGRALDMPYGEVDKIAKMIPTTLNIELEDALKQTPQLQSLRKSDERVKELVEVALRLEGLARHASTHAAGVVISPRPLTEIVPLYKSNKDEITTQYDMNALERIGLLKMDFLGLTTLTVLDDAVRLVKHNRGVDLDLSALPLDDARTYAIFSRGDTTGIFQFESHGMRDILKRYQPTRLEDLTALNALYRPGPIQGGMIPDFIARKHGEKKVTYDLPELEEFLSETWGVILYQEQVMQIANRLAGFSLGDADLLRRAMGKKKPEEMAAQREKFLTGCQAHKVPAKKAAENFRPDGGVCRLRIQQIALLRLCAARLPDGVAQDALSGGIHGRDAHVGNRQHRKGGEVHQRGAQHGHHRASARREFERHEFHARRRRHSLRPRRHQERRREHGEGNSRRARGAGPVQEFLEFCESVDARLLNKRVLESLVRAGALDGLGAHRAQMIAVIDRAIERAQKLQRAKESGQHGLFMGGQIAPVAPPPENLPDVDEWPEHELLAAEYSTLGFFISGHPLDKYAGRLQDLKAVELSTLEGRRNGEDIVVAGIIVQSRPMRSRRGARWAILILQDHTGVIEALVFPEAFQKLEPILKAATPLLIKGRVAVEDVGTRVIVADARLLDQVATKPSNGAPSLLRVRVDLGAIDPGALDQLHELFSSHPGRCRVAFELVKGDGSEATLEASSAVQADRELVERVREICGSDSVAVVQ